MWSILFGDTMSMSSGIKRRVGIERHAGMTKNDLMKWLDSLPDNPEIEVYDTDFERMCTITNISKRKEEDLINGVDGNPVCEDNEKGIYCIEC